MFHTVIPTISAKSHVIDVIGLVQGGGGGGAVRLAGATSSGGGGGTTSVLGATFA